MEFPKVFPGGLYYNNINEILVSCPCHCSIDKLYTCCYLFSSDKAFELMNRLHLSGNIITMGPGCDPVPPVTADGEKMSISLNNKEKEDMFQFFLQFQNVCILNRNQP